MASEPGQRQVAGVWCGEVLERLPDLMDGTLDPAEVARIEAHVAGCDWCERFGGAYGQLVKSLRGVPADGPDGLADRLARDLDRRLGSSTGSE